MNSKFKSMYQQYECHKRKIDFQNVRNKGCHINFKKHHKKGGDGFFFFLIALTACDLKFQILQWGLQWWGFSASLFTIKTNFFNGIL